MTDTMTDIEVVLVAAELHDYAALMQAAERIGFRPPELDETLAQYAEAVARAE